MSLLARSLLGTKNTYNILEDFALQTPCNSPESSDEECKQRELNKQKEQDEETSSGNTSNKILDTVKDILFKIKKNNIASIISDWKLFEGKTEQTEQTEQNLSKNVPNKILDTIKEILFKIKKNNITSIISDWQLFEKRFGKMNENENEMNYVIINQILNTIVEIRFLLFNIKDKNKILIILDNEIDKFIKEYDL